MAPKGTTRAAPKRGTKAGSQAILELDDDVSVPDESTDELFSRPIDAAYSEADVFTMLNWPVARLEAKWTIKRTEAISLDLCKLSRYNARKLNDKAVEEWR